MNAADPPGAGAASHKSSEHHRTQWARPLGDTGRRTAKGLKSEV